MVTTRGILCSTLALGALLNVGSSFGFQYQARFRERSSSLRLQPKEQTAAVLSLKTSLISSKDTSGKGLPVVDAQEKYQTDYQTGILTIGFCTLVFASLSPVNHAALAGTEMPVLLLNCIVSLVAFLSVSLGGRFLECILPEMPNNVNQREGIVQRNSNDSWQLNHWIGGAELGFWKAAGTTANLYGLSLTTADHGAFLIQLTTLIVPFVQGIMGVPISKRIQTSIALALGGIFLFTQDHTGITDIQDTVIGDGLCVLAAIFYATYDLRLFQWGKRIDARPLITSKILTQAVLSIGLLIGGLGISETAELFRHPETWCTPTVLGLMAWSGCMVSALVPFLQVGGQQAIGPTTSQTIYSSQPLWAALMSFVWFGETVGNTGFLGGCAFVTALFLAATAQPPESAVNK